MSATFQINEAEAIRLAADNASKAHSTLVVYNTDRKKQREARQLLMRSLDLLHQVFDAQSDAEHETWPCYCGHVRGTHPNSGFCQGGDGNCDCQEYREGAEPEQDAQVAR